LEFLKKTEADLRQRGKESGKRKQASSNSDPALMTYGREVREVRERDKRNLEGWLEVGGK